jgi:hypothetical protein
MKWLKTEEWFLQNQEKLAEMEYMGRKITKIG